MTLAVKNPSYIRRRCRPRDVEFSIWLGHSVNLSSVMAWGTCVYLGVDSNQGGVQLGQEAKGSNSKITLNLLR